MVNMNIQGTFYSLNQFLLQLMKQHYFLKNYQIANNENHYVMHLRCMILGGFQ